MGTFAFCTIVKKSLVIYHRPMRFILLSILLCGCGSIANRKEIFLLDSNPRGIPVKLNDEPLGVTPLTTEAPRKRNNNLTLGKERKNLTCGLDYQYSVIGNGILTYLNPAFGIVGFGLDFLNDKLFVCQGRKNYKLEKVLSKKKINEKVIIIPINKIEQYKTNLFLSKLNTKIKSTFKKGDKLVKYRASSEKFIELGINESTLWKLEKIKKASLYKVAHAFGATQVVFVNVRDESIGKDQISFKKYDIFTQEEIGRYFFVYKKEKSKDFELSNLKRRYFHLFPNAISLGSTFPSVYDSEDDFDENDTEELELIVKKHPSSLPNFLTYWSLETIVSPELYSPWDSTFIALPSASFPSWQIENSISSDYLNVSTGFFTMDFSWIGFTPYFSASINYGLGMGVINQSGNNTADSLIARPISKFGMNITTFVTHRTYLRFGFQNYSLSNDTIIFKDNRFDTYSETTLSIGYYYPKTRMWFY